jgi:Ca2+-binding EF-hand superfamily protein
MKFYHFYSDREWIERTIAQNDKDGDGGISLEEFIEMNINRNRSRNSTVSHVERKSPNDILLEKARLAFNAYDRNRDGYLTKAELRKTSKNMTEAQIDAVFEKYDKNKDGRLDFEEFKDLMQSNTKSKRLQKQASTASGVSPPKASASTPDKE